MAGREMKLRMHNTESNEIIVPVALANRSYDIVIGENLLATIGERIAPLLRRRRLLC